MPKGTPKRISVRPASVADSVAIAHVCLVTAYQGRSAQTLVRHPELPSQVQALPYLHLPSGFGFVLVETTEEETVEPEPEPELESFLELDSEPGSSQPLETAQSLHEKRIETAESRSVVVGYVVGTNETAQFEREIDALWWPALRVKYPKGLAGTPLDRYFIDLIHKGPRISSAGASHIHVNVVEKYKNQGYDRLLVDVALRHLRARTERCHRSPRLSAL